MIFPNPNFLPPHARCYQHEAARNLTDAVVLLHRCKRTQAENSALLRAAHAVWECAGLSDLPSARIAAGLLLTQVYLALERYQEATVTAQRVQKLAGSAASAIPVTVRAMLFGAQASNGLGREDHAEHLLGLARALAATCHDPNERARLAEFIAAATVIDPTAPATQAEQTFSGDVGPW